MKKIPPFLYHAKLGRGLKSGYKYEKNFYNFILFQNDTRGLTEEQSADIDKLLHALRVLHFPITEDPTTHVEIKFVNSSGVDEIIYFGFTKFEELRKKALMEKKLEIPTENLKDILSALHNLYN